MSVSRRRATLATLAGGSTNTLIVSIQAVVLIPLYLNAIGPKLYGAWLGSGDILVWMQAFDLGLPNLMIQRIGSAQGRGDSKLVGEYFATGMVTLAIVASLILMGALAVSSFLPDWMGLVGDEAHELKWVFIVGAVAASLNIFNNSIVGFSRGIQKTTFMNAVVVVAGLLGFGVSLVLVLTGWGLWAIAWGLVARTFVSFIGGIIFSITNLRGGLIRFFRVRRVILREFLTILPATALGGISYAVMNQSESAIAAIFVRPELATVLTLTRKAVEVAHSLVDMISVATYGSFAHLVASVQRHRTLKIHAEISSLRFTLALSLAAAYMAVNGSLVSLWVGEAQYGGALLTILIALRFILTGGSYLVNYLYRAAGPVMRGSWALLGESLIRVPLMVALLYWLGLPGLPLAGIVTALISWVLVFKWTIQEVAPYSDPYPITPNRVWAARAIVIALGAAACVIIQWKSWVYVVGMGAILTFISSMLLVYIDPIQTDIRSLFDSALSRVFRIHTQKKLS